MFSTNYSKSEEVQTLRIKLTRSRLDVFVYTCSVIFKFHSIINVLIIARIFFIQFGVICATIVSDYFDNLMFLETQEVVLKWRMLTLFCQDKNILIRFRKLCVQFKINTRYSRRILCTCAHTHI